MSGFYLMSRGWMDHPALAGREPFSRREAWLWMIEQAHWQPRGVSIGGKTVEIERGQFCHSYRYMAKAWEWEIGRVQRFIGRLVADGMIGVSVEHGQTLLTLCNYDKYQGQQCIGDTPADTAPIQERYATDTNKKQGKQGKQIKEEEKGDPNGSLKNVAPVIDVLPIVEPEQPEPAEPVAEQKPRRRKSALGSADVDMIAFEEFWQTCPKRQAKPVAISAYAAAIESGASAGQLLIAIRRYAGQVKADGTEGRFIKTPGPWLNAKRYLDEYPDDQPDDGQIRSPPFQSSRQQPASYFQAARNVLDRAARHEEQF